MRATFARRPVSYLLVCYRPLATRISRFVPWSRPFLRARSPVSTPKNCVAVSFRFPAALLAWRDLQRPSGRESNIPAARAVHWRRHAHINKHGHEEPPRHSINRRPPAGGPAAHSLIERLRAASGELRAAAAQKLHRGLPPAACYSPLPHVLCWIRHRLLGDVEGERHSSQ